MIVLGVYRLETGLGRPVEAAPALLVPGRIVFDRMSALSRISPPFDLAPHLNMKFEISASPRRNAIPPPLDYVMSKVL